MARADATRRMLVRTEGVSETRAGTLRVYVKVRGRQVQKTFPHGTALADLVAWRDRTARELGADTLEPGRTLADDARRFLKSLAGKRQANFRSELAPWLKRFGNLPRRRLTRDQVITTLTALQDEGLAPSSLNHRRQALISLWRFCDGKRHACPASDVEPFREPKPEPRAVDAALLDSVFAAMPVSRAKAHLLLIRWTGARPSEVAALTPERVLLDGETPYIHYTTGKGGHDRVVPLGPHGVEAARLFVSLNAWGTVDRATMGVALQRAYVRAVTGSNPTPEQREQALAGINQGTRPTGRRKWRLTPYVLRHTFLTELRRTGADLADVQAIAGHKRISTTARYAPTVDAKLVEAVRRHDASFDV